MKVIIIGSSGILGSKLLDKFSKKYQTLGTFFSSAHRSKYYKNILHLDVTHHEIARRFLIDFNPNVVIYCASIRPDECEKDPERAYAVHYEGLKNIASACASLKIKTIFISTDYVFSGEKETAYIESDTTSPINVFGKSKEKAEKYLMEHIPNSCIIRIPMIYGYSPETQERGLLHFLLHSLSKNEPLELDNHKPRYPILADDIANLIEILIQKDETGTYHLSTDVPYTKYEFGKLTCAEYNYNSSLIKPIVESEEMLIAKRPHKIHLDSSRAIALGAKITQTEDGISIHKKQNTCLFRMIYSARPDMLVAGQNTSEFRISAGRTIVQENPIPEGVDYIVPIPESGIYSATGVAAESKKPFIFGIIRDYFTEKTLYSASSESRHTSLKRKLIPIASILKDKSIVLVDEAVLSGSTLSVVIEKLKSIHVKEIHVRIPSPVIANPCTGLILPNLDFLVKNTHSLENAKEKIEASLAKKFDVASFHFLSLKGFLSLSKSKNCHDCFLKETKDSE